jgi:hypothetical protein
MALKSYIVTQNFKSPIVRVTGMPHKPQEIRFKKFIKGDIIKGELKHANNQPAFILVGGACVVPLNVVKELVTKEIVSDANGESTEANKKEVKIVPNQGPRMKYLDAVIIGGALGAGAAFLAEKQGWIAMPDKKNKIYGAVIGAAIGLYMVYRFKLNKPKTNTTEE